VSTPVPGPEPRGGGNILQQRLGPFATWVWLLFATIAILIYAYVGNRKKAAASAQATAGQSVAAQQVPDIIIQNQEGTETETPTGSVPPAPPTTTPPPGKPPAKPPVRHPGPPPKGKPTKPAQYKIVQVARYTEDNPPWNSTLWGIAQHEAVKGGWQALAKLNGIKDPRHITPGQKIRVPA
jgi:hypothetical protein